MSRSARPTRRRVRRVTLPGSCQGRAFSHRAPFGRWIFDVSPNHVLAESSLSAAGCFRGRFSIHPLSGPRACLLPTRHQNQPSDVHDLFKSYIRCHDYWPKYTSFTPGRHTQHVESVIASYTFPGAAVTNRSSTQIAAQPRQLLRSCHPSRSHATLQDANTESASLSAPTNSDHEHPAPRVEQLLPTPPEGGITQTRAISTQQSYAGFGLVYAP